MPEDPERLAAIAAQHATVADKIRALAGAGVARADIARFLGKRYQHVRNVLEDDAQSRPEGGGQEYVVGKADLSGVREEAQPQGDVAPESAGSDEPEAPSAEVIDLSSAPEPEPEPPIVTVPEPVTAATPEPVAVVEAAAEPAPRPIDANEIVAPPATPKRGWWRRGA